MKVLMDVKPVMGKRFSRASCKVFLKASLPVKVGLDVDLESKFCAVELSALLRASKPVSAENETSTGR